MDFDQAMPSSPGEERPPPQDRPPGSGRRYPVHARHRMSAAGDSRLFPSFTTIQNYFYAWGRNGTFNRMMDRLSALGRALSRRSETPTAAATDTQSAKTTESGGLSGCDTGKKVKGRKRRIAIDVEGFPIKIANQEASVQDRHVAPAAVLGMLEAPPLVRKLWADGGYRGPKLSAAALKDLGLGSVLEIVE